MSVLTPSPLKAAPSAAAGVAISTGYAPAWGARVEVFTTAAPIAIAGVQIFGASYSRTMWDLEIALGGAGVERSIGTLRLHLHDSGPASAPVGVLLPVPLGGIVSGTRLSVRARSRIGEGPTRLALNYYENLSSDHVIGSSARVLSSGPSGTSLASLTPSATPWANSAWLELVGRAPRDLWLIGLVHGAVDTGAEDGIEYDLGTGPAGAETVITTLRDAAAISKLTHTWLPAIYPVVTGTRVSVRMRKAGTNTDPHAIAVLYYTRRVTTLDRPMFTTGGTSGPLSWMELTLKTEPA